MLKKLVNVGLGLVLVLVVAGAGFAAEVTQAQTLCPVLGGKINKNFHGDYQGNRVYFCCPDCIKSFQKNPEQYLKKMQAQGIVPEKSPGGK